MRNPNYYKENREEILSKKREYYKKHREKLLEGSKLYYKTHREEIIKRSVKNYQKDGGLAKQASRLYGISLEEYQQLWKLQDGVCAICRSVCKTGKSLALDHNHKTGKIRGFLCDSCNRGIGFFKDNSIFLRSAAEYLEKTDGQ